MAKLRLSQLRQETKTASLTIQGQPFRVVYRPAVITPELIDSLRASNPATEDEADAEREERDHIGGAVKTIVAAVAEWDLVDEGEDENGETVEAPYPLTIEAVKKLPLEFITQVFRLLMGESQPGESKQGSFGDG